MKEVILVNEEDHGLIAVAHDYFSAIKYLVENDWLTETVAICAYEDLEQIGLIFGENWIAKILSWNDVSKFNEVFEGSFSLRIETVV